MNPETRRSLMFLRMAEYMKKHMLDPSRRISDLGDIQSWLMAQGLSANTAMGYTSCLLNWLSMDDEERAKSQISFMMQHIGHLGRPQLPEIVQKIHEENQKSELS